MALRHLLDSDMCIYALSGRHLPLRRRIDRLAPGRVGISVIVYGELQFGIAKSVRSQDALLRLEAFTQVVPVIELPASAGEHYGDIRAALGAAGTPIGANDLWIAAHARAASLTLVTNNTREFGRVDGLALENWMAG